MLISSEEFDVKLNTFRKFFSRRCEWIYVFHPQHSQLFFLYSISNTLDSVYNRMLDVE
jgi:hypothetical protein